jgi:2-oxoisovalerate ferredoxin oxidoreductase beta subunit
MANKADMEVNESQVPAADFEIVHSKSRVFYPAYERKSDLKQQTHYCPGCGHGVIHKLIAETIEDLGLQDKTIFVSPVGCSVFAYFYFDLGNVQVAHGRTPAAATGIKRSCPDKVVIAYQGDGDLAAIGTAEIVHAANRGEKISVFFVNNAIYGMTGGQSAPTTLVGQKTTTSPWGRRPSCEGHPLHIAELLATLEAPVYIERVALSNNKNVMNTRRAIRKAIENQLNGLGFSLVEILSPCPTIWGMEPVAARKWVGEQMIPVFPLKVFRDREAAAPVENVPPQRTVAEVLGLQSVPGVDAEQGFRNTHEFDNLQLKVAGFGGQGVLLLGQLLAEAGMCEGLEVSWLPSYGPEMRSGSAHCHVCISKERIGSPLISHPDVLIAMNEISLRKFADSVPPTGLIIYNGSALPRDFAPASARVLCVPASSIADNLGASKVANIVLLGTMLKETRCLDLGSALAVIRSKTSKTPLLEANQKALQAGWEWADQCSLTLTGH